MQTGSEPLIRALQEILDSVATEAARNAMIGDALSSAGLAELPRTAAELLDFIEGPLLVTLERALGRELGRSVVDELERWIGPLSTRPRAVAPLPSIALPQSPRVSELPVEPHPPASGDYPSGVARALGLSSTQPPGRRESPRTLPLVFVATTNQEVVDRFTQWLDPRAVIIRVSRLVDMLLDMDDAGARRVVIVVDYEHPAVRPQAFAAIAEELPHSARVVLWGANRDAHAALCRVSPAVARWTTVPPEAPVTELVQRCASLVG